METININININARKIYELMFEIRREEDKEIYLKGFIKKELRICQDKTYQIYFRLLPVCH